MKTVGQILKEAREKKDVSLEEAEKATRIRKKILSRLEKSDWAELPSPTFVKGLLKNYGSYLEIDTKALLAFFRREYEEPKLQKAVVSFKVKRPKLRFTPQIITGSILALIFLGAGAYLYTQYQSFTAAPVLEVTEPGNNIKIETLDVNVVGRTYQDADLKINGQKAQLSPGGTFSIAVSLVEGVNTIVVTSENRFGQISTEKRTVIVETRSAGVTDQTEPKNKEDQKQDNISLDLKIGPESTNIRIELDGKKVFDGVLVSGSSKTYSAKERIKVFTSNAGSTKVIFEGKEQTLGKEGEALEREFKKTS
ncbi:MAG: RodZ domain-containing protein [Candidatus Woykebacteria bacterium]